VPRRRIPSYRHYKPKDLGQVVLNGRYHYLGKYGTPESLRPARVAGFQHQARAPSHGPP
jgi:hypothetical protein